MPARLFFIRLIPMYHNAASFAAEVFPVSAEVCLQTLYREKRYDFFISLLFFCLFSHLGELKSHFKQAHWLFGPRAPPPGFDFQHIQILEVTNVKNNGKRVIELDGRKIEVSEEVYKEYQRGQRKERYIMKDLKRGQIRIDGEKITVKPGREDSVERLIETNPQYFVEESDGPEELLDKKELLECLTKALRTLTDEEWLLIQELYYLERTEREAGKSLHMASSTVHDRKIAILKKLREFF